MSAVEAVEPDPLPSTLDEAVTLILQMYQPDGHGKVAKIQETLQKLQRSAWGWELAYSLREHPSEQVRFFAALTFTVKLNTDAKSLNDENTKALLETLITWLIRCVENLEKPLVMRKLCSTLVAYFFQFSTSWERCIKHLMYCICIKVAIPYDALEEAPDTVILVSDILDTRAIAVFWNKFHQRVVPNVEDIIPLMAKYLDTTSSIPVDGKVRAEALKCFQAWVFYSHRAFIDDAIVLDPLRTLTKSAIMCLADESLYEIAIELFTEVLSSYSNFLTEDDFQLLYSLFDSPWAQERYQRLIQGDFDFDSLQFGLFTIAFGDANLQNLAKNNEKERRYENFLSALAGLLEAGGYAVHEDKIFVPALEFWSTFVENMIDDIYSVEGENPAWFPAAQVHVNRAIDRCWRKIQFPPNSVFNSWDSVDRTGFKDARRDFGDLLQQFYLVSGMPLLDIFIEKAQTSIKSRNWAELEASLFCLSVFPDCVAEDERRDEHLKTIFSDSIFFLFAEPENGIPPRTVQSFLLIIDAYADYFEQNTTYLPNALNIVFGATASPALSHKASYTILRLCSDCRKILLPELGAFLQQYQALTLNSSLDKYVKENIIEGIASLIQAIPDDQSKIAPLDQLLNFVDVDIDNCIRALSSQVYAGTDAKNTTENGLIGAGTSAVDFGLVALRCLAGIGKGLQAPHDQPVDLEEKETGSPFWTTGGGSRIQQRIFSMVIKVYNALGSQGDIIDAACYVWRQGFRELEPGPFVMAPTMIAEFLLKANPQTPRLVCVIGTACSFVTSHKTGPGIDNVLDVLLNWISQLLQAQQEPSNDPEVAQNGIDFLTRLLPKYTNTLMKHQPASSLEFLFMFTLKAITGSDPLPKIAACDFWTTFIGLSNQGDHLQEPIDNVMRYLGPLLAQALIFNIGGHAARSDLDKLAEPLKKLVSSQALAKSWFEAALFSDTFPSNKVSTKDKTIFLQKVTLLRGAKGTNQPTRNTTFPTPLEAQQLALFWNQDVEIRMPFDCNRRSWAAATLLLLLAPYQINSSTITNTPQATATSNTIATCEFRTINYITDSLPQLCFRSAWSSTNRTSSANPAPTENATVTSDGIPIEEAATPSSDPSKSIQDSVQNVAANATWSNEATPSASIVSVEPTPSEDDSSELNEASFLSFEEWKKQALEKAGQKDANLGVKKSASAENRRREAESLRESGSFGPMGEEEELDLDFSAFRDGGKAQEAVPPVQSKDAQVLEETQEQEKVRQRKEHYRSKDAGKTCKERFSYASFDAGATILKTHSGAKNSKAVLIENKDSYMLSECSAQNKFLIIELSEDIWIDTIVLANYEFFSSMIRTFRVSVSDRYPVKIEKWKDVGTYEARNSREIQAFLIENPQIWARYLRIEFLSHYGNEYYCPLSLVRVHGTRMLESWKESEAIGEEEEAEYGESGGTEDEFVHDAVADVVQEEERLNAELRAAAEEIVKNAHAAAIENSRSAEVRASKNMTSPWTKPNFISLYGLGTSHHEEVCLPIDAPKSESATFLAALISQSTESKLAQVGTESSSAKDTPSTSTSTTLQSIETVPTKNATVEITTSGVLPQLNMTSSSSSSNTGTTSSSPPATPPASKVQNTTASPKNKTTSTSSAASSLPTIQESFFKAVSRRLQLLEANSTLSLKYIEEQSKILREAFSKVEKKQLQKTTSFIDTLNKTVLAELQGFRQQYDEIWQSTVISLESQREESRREILAISARLNILADEVIFQKRMSIVQSILLLLCLGLVIFSRVSAGGQLDFPNMHGRIRNLSAESPLQSPPESPEFRRTRSGRWLEPGHRRQQSDESRSRSRENSPPTPVSSYSRSENNLTPPPGPEEPSIRIKEDLPELRSDHLELPSTSQTKRRRSGSSAWKDSNNSNPVTRATSQSSPNRTLKKRKSSLARQQPSPPQSNVDDSDLADSPSRDANPSQQDTAWTDEPWIDEEQIGIAISSPEVPPRLREDEKQSFSIARKPLPALPRNGA
ncbi:hypothetical protein G7Y89_g8231 [Cudoniella acicularis]|uniref:SUN domain-containing protein n=1 Tax=Cudoniella acicularis TaxID=354080 RepID=A0A8H4RII7_9HELO|nr:hypothetical protein G7Y89_g8231 [Cudoniella acicularis]